MADHVIPNYPGMPDSLFFSERNLRASCRGHNLARGLIGDTPPQEPTATVDYTRKADDAG